jgi:methylated-DNA-[protein]-cysteine S-methyltransferase
MTHEPVPRFLRHPSPIGDVLIITRGDRVFTAHPVAEEAGPDSAEATLSSVARRIGMRAEPGEEDAALALAGQIDEYFVGSRQGFDVPLEWSLVAGFTRAALEAIMRIPFAETASYGEVAVMAGTPRAARAVGTACATTPFSLIVPVHRVIRADGSLGQYGGRPEIKLLLLEHERRVAAGGDV